MIRQKIGGRTVNTVIATGSADDMNAIATLMEGKLETYKLKFEGGTASPAPASHKKKKFSVGKRYLSGQRKSASVQIPHVKTSVSFAKIQSSVIGQFDEAFDSNVKCEYSNLFFDRKEVA